MRLALAEIRRAKLRFGALTGAVALLVFLILFQQSLSGSLLVTVHRWARAPVGVRAWSTARTLAGAWTAAA